MKKPVDWGQNEREQLLTIVDDFCDDFLRDPTYINKERLITVTTFDEPTRHGNLGTFRFTDYECGIINELYFKFKSINFQYGIGFIYCILFNSARLAKTVLSLPGLKFDLSSCYRGLYPYLKFFFLASFHYFFEKQRSFADELICELSAMEKASVMDAEEEAVIFNTILYDLSGNCVNHFFKDFNFSREDIYKLINKSSELMKKAKIKQTDRPHKGVLCMTIANFILRSRNNYCFENVYKCVSKQTVIASFDNNELWMRRRTKLNDKREGKAIREVFSNRSWIKCEWAKTMKFTYERESFTCSFSTKFPSDRQKKTYGSYIYGYHNDVVGPSITTLVIKHNPMTGREIAAFSQYTMYDVLYSRDEFKREMNYLFSVIDCFALSDDEKKHFLEEIIDYWKLSIKDKRWAYENERRYEIMHFNEYVYAECAVDEVFLKNKTPLLLYPDFVIGDNPKKELIKRNIINKAGYKNLGCPSRICDTCLFESTLGGDKCLICGSEKLRTINQKSKE